MRAAQTAQRDAEKRARRYALQDQQRQFDLEQEAAENAYQRQLGLQEAELAGRLQLQGGDIRSRYGLQALEGAQRLEQAEQGFGFQQALAEQGFGFDTALTGQRFAGQIDLAQLDAELQGERDEKLFGFGMLERQFDVEAQTDRDYRQSILQNWLGEETYGRLSERDRALFSQDVSMTRIRDELETVREFRQDGFQQQRDQSNHDFAREMIGLKADWDMKAMNAQANLERQGIVTDQYFTMRYADMAKGQEKVRRGIAMLTDEDQSDLAALRSAYSLEMRNTEHDSFQKSAAIAQIVDRMASIYDSAQPMPAEMRTAQREEVMKNVFGDAWDSVRDLPWVQTPDGDIQLPRGYQPPDPNADWKAQQEQKKALDASHTAQLKQFSDETKAYHEALKARQDTIQAYTLQESTKDLDTKKTTINLRYIDPRTGGDTTLANLQSIVEQMYPATKPTPPMLFSPISPSWPGVMPGQQWWNGQQGGVVPDASMQQADRFPQPNVPQNGPMGPQQPAVPSEAVPEHVRDADPFIQNYKMGLSLIPQMTAEQAEKQLSAGAIYRNEKGEVKRVPQPPFKKPFQTLDIR